MITPIRRLEGISYWVIDDPEGIWAFISTEVMKEWEDDIRSNPTDPAAGAWLATLPKRRWHLEMVRTSEVTLDQQAMNFVNSKTGYNFAERLAQRRKGLREELERWSRVIWPIIVRGEDMQVLDGYCRYTTLQEMGIQRIYAYVGYL